MRIQSINISGRIIGGGKPAYIIAEISANHNQSYEQAVKLIHAAKNSGADAVKLQTYTPDTITIDCKSELFPESAKAPYGKANISTIFTARPILPGNGMPDYSKRRRSWDWIYSPQPSILRR